MTREELIAAADRLPHPSDKAAWEYETKAEVLALEVNRIMSARQDLDALIGPNNTAMMEDNHRNHARFMASLLQDFRPEVLVDTVLWVFRAYRAHGFQLTYWPAQLDVWLEVLNRELSPEAYESIKPCYEFMIIHQPAFAELSDEALRGNSSFHLR